MPKKRKKTRSLSSLLHISITSIGLVGSIAVLINLYGLNNWPGELIGLFSIQWGGLLVFFSALSALKKNKVTTLVLVLLAIYFLFPLATHYSLNRQKETSLDSISYRLLSYELGKQNRNPEAILEFIYTEGADLIYLQQVELSDNEWLNELKLDYPYHKILSRSGGYGIAVFMKQEWTTLQVVDFELAAHPSISVRSKIGNQDYEFILSHLFAPFSIENNEYRKAQTNALIAWIDELPTTVSPILAGPLFLGNKTASKKQIEDKTSLKDASLGYGWKPTWPQQTNLSKIKTDHVFVDTNKIHIQDYKLGPALGSAHSPLIVDLSMSNTK